MKYKVRSMLKLSLSTVSSAVYGQFVLVKVENRTLQSQSSSLLDQINSLQADYTKLEADLVKITKQVRTPCISALDPASNVELHG